MWCSPVPSDVSPMYMPGRLRTASRPLRILMLEESYSSPCWRGLVCAGVISAFVSNQVQRAASEDATKQRGRAAALPRESNAHRHDDVLIIVALGQGDERAGIGVAECEVDLVAAEVRQDVEQIRDVEADVDAFAAVRHRQLLLGLFLLAVRTDYLELIVSQNKAHAPEFLVRQNRRALQRRQQRHAVELDALAVAGGNDPVVVGKLAVDDLRDELDVGEAEARLIREDVDRYRRVAVLEQLLELEHGLARQDHLGARIVAFDRDAGPGQP